MNYKKKNLSYFNFLLILVNSTSPASIGKVSCPAEIISLQSSKVWSVVGTFRALKYSRTYKNINKANFKWIFFSSHHALKCWIKQCINAKIFIMESWLLEHSVHMYNQIQSRNSTKVSKEMFGILLSIIFT